MSSVNYTGYWILISNPKDWLIDDFLNDLKQDSSLKYSTWTVPKWQKDEFYEGQYGVI